MRWENADEKEIKKRNERNESQQILSTVSTQNLSLLWRLQRRKANLN
jgi:hypothetical protein